MAIMSRGRPEKPFRPKNTKGGTPSSRKHHFESFSQRIAKLSIDPVRRVRRPTDDDGDVTANFSYFKTSLDDWRDRNISEDFTKFSREVNSLCESLPQILHHGDRILDILLEYIEKGDIWSLEPLLNLVGHFAHDLGVRFEKHFARTVSIVSQLAATRQEPEIIEWSFTCLAWLFKYLSKLLVPDLRPLFDLMAPLLGKRQQKYFVMRFAAESLSFLFRKATASYHRDKTPLENIFEHIVKDLQGFSDQKNIDQYKQGLMVLITESIKGVQNGVHSGGQVIVQELMAQTYASLKSREYQEPSSAIEDVLKGVVTALIHHTNSTTFKPLLTAILKQIRLHNSPEREDGIRLSAQLIFLVSGVRKGNRVEDWKDVLETLDSVTAGIEGSRYSTAYANVLSAYAVVFQSCPLEASISHLRVLERFTTEPWESHFLPFCMFFASLGSERFGTLLLPHFRRFIASKWQTHGDELCVVLPRLSQNSAIPSQSLKCPVEWQEQAVTLFNTIAETTHSRKDALIYKCNGFISASQTLAIDPSHKENMLKSISSLFDKVLQSPQSSTDSPRNIFAFGTGFSYLIKSGHNFESLQGQWQSLCLASTNYGHHIHYWQALLSLITKGPQAFDFRGPHMETLKAALLPCLGSPSHGLRLAALEVLSVIVSTLQGEICQILSTAILIEESPIGIETSRSLSMNMRKLATSYKSVASDPWLSTAIPQFCFGLLHVRFAQLWDDSCSALKEICATSEGEAAVSQIAFAWLESIPDHPEIQAPKNDEAKSTERMSEFECSNVNHLIVVIEDTQKVNDEASSQLKDLFESQHQPAHLISSANRTQALRVLNAIPHVAEKRSRLLVPVLLDWVSKTDINTNQEASEDDAVDAEEAQPLRWARKEQKAMLSLFAQFVNPKVLYKSTEVYSTLLSLLENGDVEIQKSALKAILTWKNAAVNRYEENLFNLLDEARFREQISVFLDIGDDEDNIQEDHREALLPIILRLLYGRVVSRSGSASGKRGQESRRKAVFIALTRLGEGATAQFLDIALGQLKDISIIQNKSLNEDLVRQDILEPRKHFGLLNMFEDFINTLQATVLPYVPRIVDPLLYCLIRASRGISEHDAGASLPQNAPLSLLKSIRQVGFHSLNMFFESCPEFAWKPYVPVIIRELAEPRLERLPNETAHSISGLLRLFSVWAKSLSTALFLVTCNPDILTKILKCLEVPSAKDEVKLFVLNDILRSIVKLVHIGNEVSTANADELRDEVRSQILEPYSNMFLTQIGNLLRKGPSKDLLETAVGCVADLAPFVVGSSESQNLIEIATFLLRQPTKRVNPQTKGNLLKILHEFIPRCDLGATGIFDDIFSVTSSLFAFFKDRPNRQVLCAIIKDLSESHVDLQEVADICSGLNSFSIDRLDEPDFERRSRAFGVINEDNYLFYNLRQWRPLVFNMLYYIKDSEELSIRVNASYSLRRFIEAASTDSDSSSVDEFKALISETILPGFQQGFREHSELVRSEYLSVLAQLVRRFPTWSPVSDLHILLAGDDDEASFFTNVLHIQQHRRSRALRRLAAETQTGQIDSGNLAHLFIPLIEHFIFDKSDDESAHNLAGEAIRTISLLAQYLEWPQYRALLVRFTSYIKSKEDMEKTVIRLVGGIMDALSHAGISKGYIEPRSTNKAKELDAAITTDARSVNGAEISSVDAEMTVPPSLPQTKLAMTLPAQGKLSHDLISNILPALMDFLNKKDESTVSLRVPIAVAVTKVLRVLPPDQFAEKLHSVLLDVCQILKSKSQDARDMTRNTLGEISTLIGSSYFGFILKALRAALQRGYQLHVLSFTMHTLLNKISSPTDDLAYHLAPGDLDYCLRDIVAIIMDDIFGVTGQEKDAEEYISKMREVKSSKSFDSMELIAKGTTLNHLVDLVRPIMALLLEKLNIKMARKIDELLRRIGLGIQLNDAVKNRDILVFCYQLIQEVNGMQSQSSAPDDDERTKKYLITMKSSRGSGKGAKASHFYKMTRFSMDILQSVLRKQESLQTPQNVAGFIPIISNFLIQGQEEVQVSAMRLLTTIIKVPLPLIDKNAPLYVAEAVQSIKNSPSSNTELAQAALKLISAILRERRDVKVKEKNIAYLLKQLKPDLDEPDRQGVTFNFLRAVMARKIAIPEVYEVIDVVAAMMVTNQTRSSRDAARSVYFQFFMEYPQAEKRFEKQLEFLIKNLSYKYVEGRQSVMEVVNLLVTKVGDNKIQEILKLVFIPLAVQMFNDESKECREMASALLKKVFERTDGEQTKRIIEQLKRWMDQDNKGLKRLAMQSFGLFVEVTEGQSKEIAYVLDHVEQNIAEHADLDEDGSWELIFYSLNTFSKLCKYAPSKTFAVGMEGLWTSVRRCISFPHVWVKVTAARLIQRYFGDFASTNAETGLDSLPLIGSGDLELHGGEMLDIMNGTLKVLRVPKSTDELSRVSEELCADSIRNIAFLARCFAANGLKYNRRKVASDDNEDEEEEGPAQASDDDFAGFSPEPEALPTALHILLARLAHLLRAETKIMRLEALFPKTATLALLFSLCSSLPTESLTPSLPLLLSPLLTLVDPATTVPRSTDPAFNDAYKALTDKAQEILSTLQKRLGTTAYVAVVGEVQRGIRERREGRRAKRRVEAISKPEEFGREKRRRQDVKRVKRKEKGSEARGARRGW
ncbi:U3 snoRNP protein Utp20 [Mytilinidion resinicola]|uniref:U3 snoRNP protein Utp20 n=1 Tax=Mytilinidion resinicola TaxID=574789 RepID=A0A6A6YFW1_9PEZI|nr:U3 snoRNP protein Utp20 [Mytilinidion resinicola]KAF2807630.1 U3 snoRNP protein Utp20 [Mytilinidion resinicola]